jgi:Recombination endonuclease VII
VTSDLRAGKGEQRVTEQQTLLEHGGCTRHRHYKLSCDQFDALHAESDGRCQICRRLPEDTSHRMLCIDHSGWLWRVRGLLCGTCNSTLGVMKDNWNLGRDYIARPWWRRECERLGLPADRVPEPDIGSAIRNQFGLVWARVHAEPGRDWEMPTQRGQHRMPMRWNALYDDYGAHNLLPYNLRQATADGTADAAVDRWVREASGWGDLRDAFGEILRREG